MDKTYSKISYCPTCNGSNDEHAAKCSWCGNQFMNTSANEYRTNITRSYYSDPFSRAVRIPYDDAVYNDIFNHKPLIVS